MMQDRINGPYDNEEILAATLRRLLPVAKELGVTRLANITGLDRIGLPVWSAIRPTSRCLAVSQGRGLCDTQAKVSALMESIEIWHAENFHSDLMFESMTRLRQFDQLPYLNPNRLALLRNVQVSSTEPLLWGRGRHLLDGSPVLIPWEAITGNFVNTSTRNMLLRSSNGLAGGVDRTSAILHSLYELVERHEIDNWHRLSPQEQQSRLVDKRSLEGALAALLRRIEQHCVVGLWDMTVELGIPSYICVLADDLDADFAFEVGNCAGYATHADPRIAVTRALLEAVQARAVTIAGSRDDLGEHEYQSFRGRARSASMRAAIADTGTACPLRAPTPFANAPAQGQLDGLVNALQANGIADMYVVDLLQERLGIPVVKCVVPQLRLGAVNESLRARLQPGNAAPAEHGAASGGNKAMKDNMGQAA